MSSNEPTNHLPTKTNGTKKKKTRQLLDVDESIDDHQNDDDDDDDDDIDRIETATSTTATSNAPPLTLPNGQLIDCKNTLHSFHVVDASPPISTTTPTRMIIPPSTTTNTTPFVVANQFTLFDGRLIDAKNTLHSFTTAAMLDRHNNHNHINSNQQLLPNPTTKLYDVDGDDSRIGNINNTAAIPTTTTNGRNVTTANTPFTLPNGQMIDGKNTLRSFVVSDRRIAAAAVESKNTENAITAAPFNTTTTPAPYTLLDGRPIDGKNTLHSFADISDSRIVTAALAANATTGTKTKLTVRAVPTGQSATRNDDDDQIVTAPYNRGPIQQQQQHIATDTTDDDHAVNDCIAAAAVANDIDGIIATGNVNNINYNNNNNYEPIFHTQAVPVQSLVVAEGELFDSGIHSSRPPPIPPTPEEKRSTVFWLVMVFAMLFVAGTTGIGVYCGTGNCGSSFSSPSSTISSSDTPTTPSTDISLPPPPPTNDPSRQPTEIPIIPPIYEVPTIDIPWSTVVVASHVACNFLSLTNLTECQATTFFDTFNGDDITVGTTIPSEIGVLTQLTYLDLYDQRLNGTIPTTLGNLSLLNFLGLRNSQLTGTIPTTLGNLIQLTYLRLDYNQLTGTIPTALGNLNQLTVLGLDNIPLLTGTIPSTLGNLIWLNYLGLDNNPQLGGTIPSALCSVSPGIDIVIDCENIVCSCCRSGGFTGSCPL